MATLPLLTSEEGMEYTDADTADQVQFHSLSQGDPGQTRGET